MQRTLHPSGTPVDDFTCGPEALDNGHDEVREVDRPATTRLARPWTVAAFFRVHTWWQ